MCKETMKAILIITVAVLCGNLFVQAAGENAVPPNRAAIGNAMGRKDLRAVILLIDVARITEKDKQQKGWVPATIINQTTQSLPTVTFDGCLLCDWAEVIADADLKWHQDGLRCGNVEVEDVSLEPGQEKRVHIFIPIKDGRAIGKGVYRFRAEFEDKRHALSDPIIVE